MRYSKATGYALHTIVHIMMQPEGRSVGVQELAEMQHLSPTYLSKIMTKLTKAGLILSTPGAKGGYKIARTEHEISFLDVINAIEGDARFFDCSIHHEGCLIENIMRDAEDHMRNELSSRLLIDIAKEAEARHANVKGMTH